MDRWLLMNRQLYNAALEERNTAWKTRKKSVVYQDQQNQLPSLKKDLPEFGEVYSQVLQATLHRLDKSFQEFFKGERGQPRFKGRNRFRSFTFTQSGFWTEDRHLKLSKIGRIKTRFHRPLEGKVKTLTILKDSDGKWYAIFSCDLGNVEVPNRSVERTIGLDLGVEKFATLSDGSMVPNPRQAKKGSDTLARRQQDLSRKKKGSNRRKKAVKLVAKAHAKVRNQRRDFHFKLANHLLKNYDQIVIEDLSISNMTRSAKGTVKEPGRNVKQKSGLNREILSAGWGQFIQILRLKAENAGVQVIAVNPRNTSQMCSGCGIITPKDLSERIHFCDQCDLKMDRDWNAARNIHRLGRSLQEAA